MPEAMHSPPLHRPGEVTGRPKGILKNPSFSGPSGQDSPDNEDMPYPPSTPLDPQEAKDITIQNTIQNAGPRRSSSTPRHASNSRRQSSAANTSMQEDPADKQRLQWDEANLYLAEQESGGRMKITEPKTPYQYGDAMDVDEEEDVAIDPRYVNVDEVDVANDKKKKSHEADIPGLDIGEAEDTTTSGTENERIVRGGSLSRESSKDKHVSVSGSGAGAQEKVGMPSEEDEEKHRHFEEQRKKHYAMSSVKNKLGHPEDEIDDDDDDMRSPKSVPSQGANGV